MASRNWTSSQRKHQSQLIHNWQPWRYGGPKSVAGKEKSKMNSVKHGLYSKRMRELKKCFKVRRQIKEFEYAAKSYLSCMKKLDLEPIEEKDREFKEKFELLKNSWESSEDTPDKLFEIEFVRSVYQQVVLLTFSGFRREQERVLTNLKI